MSEIARPRAIFIGPPKVYDTILKVYPQFEFVANAFNIDDFWNKMDNEEIDNDVQIVLIPDKFFKIDGSDSDFEIAVSSLIGHCFVGILSYKPELRGSITEKVEREKLAHPTGVDTTFYFIDPQHPVDSMREAISSFVADSPEDMEPIVNIFRGVVSIAERAKVREQRKAELDIESKFRKGNDQENPYLGRVLCVTSSKGGSGKSTVAISVATYMAHASVNSVREGLEKRPLKIVVVDLDVRDGQIGFLIGALTPTMRQIRIKGISKESIEKTVIHAPRLKFDVLLAPRDPRAADDLAPEFYVELIHQLRQMYDYVILDTSVNFLDPLLSKVAYPISDQIIFVTDIVINSIYSMNRWIQEVTNPKEGRPSGMGIPRNKIGIVINKVLKDVDMPGSKIAKAAFGCPVIAGIPSNPKAVAFAANNNNMEALLKRPDFNQRLSIIARVSIGNAYKLSKNTNP